MSTHRILVGLLGLFVAGGPTVSVAREKVAVIDRDPAGPSTKGQEWCQFLSENGHPCTVFPREGPTEPLDSFDVVVDLSWEWTDPAGTLADFMRAGKTVLTVQAAPIALDVENNPTVQAWIGSNEWSNADGPLVAVARDPILGDIAPGEFVNGCGNAACVVLRDTSGHPGAKVLAEFSFFPQTGSIGIMRNIWEGGISVFLTDFIEPPTGEPNHTIILNSVRIRQLIPTIGEWGLLGMGLAIAIGGTTVLLRRARSAVKLIATLFLTQLAPPCRLAAICK